MSKNVTFIIGNGFDLNVGLKTRYTDFYKVYTTENINDNPIIKKFKKEILKSEIYGWKNWMDFEIGLGKQSTLFNGETQVEDFIECFDDFVINFNKYLIAECEKINWQAVDETVYREFALSIKQFYSHIKSVPSKTIQQLIQHPVGETAKINFIQFNYTNLLDELLIAIPADTIPTILHFEIMPDVTELICSAKI